jgi:signal peptidase
MTDTENTDTETGPIEMDGGAEPTDERSDRDGEVVEEEDDSEGGALVDRATLWRAAHVVGLLVLIAVLVPFVIYAVPQVVGAEHSFVVLSGSMEPAMSPGDVIVVEDVDAAAIQQGDVISFTRSDESRPTSHRVIGVVQQDGERRFQTMGDANEDPDQGTVSPAQVEGRVMTVGGSLFVIPVVGYVIRFASTQLGIVALVLVPLTLLVLNEVWNVVSSTRGGSDDEDRSGRDADGSDAPAVVLRGNGTDGAAGSDTAADADPGDDSAGITISPTELRIGLGVLLVFAAYAAWIAYATLAVWAIGVAVSVAVAALLLAGLYLFGGAPAEDDPSAGETAGRDEVPVRFGSPPEEDLRERGQAVASFGTLVELAAATDNEILANDRLELYTVGTDGAVYFLTGTPEEPWASRLEDGGGGEGDDGADSGDEEREADASDDEEPTETVPAGDGPTVPGVNSVEGGTDD